MVEGHVTPSQSCSLILDDAAGVCGYAFALSDAKTAMTKAQVQKPPQEIKPHKYTALQKFGNTGKV